MDINRLKQIIGDIPVELKFDKISYPTQGEWDYEPWYIEWEINNIKCVIHRKINKGFLCGYIGLPINHPYFGIDSEEFPIGVDGGWNYEAKTPWFNENYVNPWWLGFNCDHSWDINPSDSYHSKDASYKTVYYVAEQLMEVINELTPNKIREREIKHLTSRKEWLETELTEINLKLEQFNG